MIARRSFPWLLVVGAFVGTVGLAAGCSSGSQPDEELNQVELGVESTWGTLTWSLPAYADPLLVPLVAMGQLTLNDRAHVLSRPLVDGPVVNTGAQTTTLGVFAKTGSVTSVGGVFLRNDARVTGDVTSSGNIETQQGATVSGLKKPQSSLTGGNVALTLNLGAPGSNVLSSTIPALPPGRYGVVNVRGQALTLVAGVYRIDELIVDPGMDVIVDSSHGPVIVLVANAFRMQGKASAFGGGFPEWVVAYSGTQDLYVGSTLDGTFLAPNAKINFSVGGRVHRGAAVAKALELHQDSTFIHQPFAAGWVQLRRAFGLSPVDLGDCRFSVPVVAFGRNGNESPSPRLLPYVGLNPLDELLKDNWGESIGATAAAFGDFDGDGHEELALGRSGNPDGRVIVLDDVHRGFSTVRDDLLAGWGETFGVRAIATGDIDNDGRDEIAVARGGGGIEITLLDDATQDFRVIDEWNLGDRNANSIAFGDTDGDGRQELVVAQDSRNGGDRIWMLQDASENYAVRTFGNWGNTDRNATAIAVGDLDGDQIDEIAVGRSPGGGGRVLIYEYDAANDEYDAVGDFANWGVTRGVTSLAFGDLDGNGDEELVVGRNDCAESGCESGARGLVFDFPFDQDGALRTLKEFGGEWGNEREVRGLATGDVDDDGRDEVFVSRNTGPGAKVIVLDDAVAGFETMQENGSTWEDHRVAAVAVSRHDVCQSRPAPPLPASATEAAAGFNGRRDGVIRRWLNTFVPKLEAGTGDDTSSEFARSLFGENMHDALHRVTAGAAAIKYNLPERDVLIGNQFPALANRYLLDNVSYLTERVGTKVGGKGDFDFQLMEHLVLIYGFGDLRLSTGDFFLSDATLAKLTVESVDVPSVGPLSSNLGGLLNNQVHELVVPIQILAELGSVPETENHVLMINTWSYLVNQLVRRGLAGGQRMLPPLSTSPSDHVNEGSPLESFLLAAVGRFVQNGSWETNARPYQALTVRALQLLATHADSPRLRTGATNALDTIAAKFAFQSLNGKRLPPMRRNWDHRHRLGAYQNDHVAAQLGVLTGAVSFDDDPECPDGRLCGYAGGNPRGYALDSALLGYRVPPTIIDFMLRPDNHREGYGFWSRLQDRFTERHYLRDKEPRYPMPNSRDMPNLNQEVTSGELDIEGAAEFYFVTRNYMNSAGGWANRYEPFASQPFGGEARDGTDFLSRPTTLVGNLDLGYWTEFPGLEQETLAFRGGSAFPIFLEYTEAYSNNTGVYKNMAYGYAYDGRPAVHVPNHWRIAASASLGNTIFSVIDSTSTGSVFEEPTHYLVVGDLPPQPLTTTIGWGLWEVVPRSLFTSEQALLQHVLAVNAGNDLGSGAGTEYTLAVSGEKIRFSDSYPPGDPFAAIDDDPAKVADGHLAWPARTMPLMDVRQVNESYRFTGIRYACASGDGRLVVNNPHLGTRLVLDSSNHQEPARQELANVAGTADPCGSVVAPSCADGIQNGTETGVDCGGSCPACPAALVTTLVTENDWGTGACLRFSIANGGTLTATSFTVAINLNGLAFNHGWNATFSGTTGTMTATPYVWNQAVPPGTTNPQIGFCVDRPNGGTALPTVTSMTPVF